MTKERVLEIIDNVLAWGNDHEEEFRECLIAAMDLTEAEIKELGLENYVEDEEDEDEEEDYMNIYDKYLAAVDSMRAPGEGQSLVAIFDTNGYLHTPDKVLKTETEIENYINKEVIPYVFINGIECDGIIHGNWISGRNYPKSTDVPKKTSDDYYVSAELLNYVNALMVAAYEYHNGKNMVTLVAYWNDSGTCDVTEFKDENDFTFQTKELD